MRYDFSLSGAQSLSLRRPPVFEASKHAHAASHASMPITGSTGNGASQQSTGYMMHMMSKDLSRVDGLMHGAIGVGSKESRKHAHHDNHAGAQKHPVTDPKRVLHRILVSAREGLHAQKRAEHVFRTANRIEVWVFWSNNLIDSSLC